MLEIFARPIVIAIEGPTHNLFIMSTTDYSYNYVSGLSKAILEKDSLANGLIMDIKHSLNLKEKILVICQQ